MANEAGESSKVVQNTMDNQKTQDKGKQKRNPRNFARRPPIKQPNAQRYPSFNSVFFSCNKFFHRATECGSRMNQFFGSFSRQCFACKKVGHRASECKTQMMNWSDGGRMNQSFVGYCFTCNKFGHK